MMPQTVCPQCRCARAVRCIRSAAGCKRCVPACGDGPAHNHPMHIHSSRCAVLHCAMLYCALGHDATPPPPYARYGATRRPHAPSCRRPCGTTPTSSSGTRCSAPLSRARRSTGTPAGQRRSTCSPTSSLNATSGGRAEAPKRLLAWFFFKSGACGCLRSPQTKHPLHVALHHLCSVRSLHSRTMAYKQPCLVHVAGVKLVLCWACHTAPRLCAIHWCDIPLVCPPLVCLASRAVLRQHKLALQAQRDVWALMQRSTVKLGDVRGAMRHVDATAQRCQQVYHRCGAPPGEAAGRPQGGGDTGCGEAEPLPPPPPGRQLATGVLLA